MFQRNVMNALRVWANKNDRKPLILRGARQVGKTTAVKEFGKEFDAFLYLNLENRPAQELFNSHDDISDILTAIFLFCNQRKTEGRTLLFIDEVQHSPRAVALLRYFYEELPELYVIAAGSLLESLINKSISFPVGRVEYMALRPCSFAEFLGAVGEEVLGEAVAQVRLPAGLHSKTMQLFNTYTLIGGMPEAVAAFALNKDLVALGDIYEALLTGFIDDIEKYSRNDTMTKVLRLLITSGWKYAAETIRFHGFAGSAYRSREMGEAFRMLEKTMLMELVYPTTSFTVPLLPDYKKSPKLIWLDTGLVNYSARIRKEVFGAADIFDAWRGKIAEHMVAQELLAADNRVSHKRHYWVRDKKGATAEVDFIVQQEGMLVPVEVKSGHNAKLKSLHMFMDSTNHSIAVRVWGNPFSIDDVQTPGGKKFRLYNIPFYYVAGFGGLL
ncbi:MAG: AAA family ATPase [Bacteroidales bacterium]|nr:AAA family ATPase [Bacteroidales bacterium]